MPVRVSATIRVLIAAFVCMLPAVARASNGAYDVGSLGQAIAAVIIFLILLAVLGKWAWKPVIAQLKQREEDVAKSIEQAKKSETEARTLADEYRQRMADAESNAEQMLAESRKEAAIARADLLEQARKESQEKVQQARKDIQRAREDVVEKMTVLTAEIAGELASKLAGENISPERHKAFLAESLEEINARMQERVQ